MKKSLRRLLWGSLACLSVVWAVHLHVLAACVSEDAPAWIAQRGNESRELRQSSRISRSDSLQPQSSLESAEPAEVEDSPARAADQAVMMPRTREEPALRKNISQTNRTTIPEEQTRSKNPLNDLSQTNRSKHLPVVTAKQAKPTVLTDVTKTLSSLPPDQIRGDPLRNPMAMGEPVTYNRTVEYLGVLVDAGRHYFPLPWLRRLVDYLALLNFNLIHFRLTDDQAFAILLDSRPELAYPSLKQRVYLPDELRALVAYAKTKGLQIMPEINLPGHAGAWAGIPGLVVNCPNFVCRKGYGVPMNVEHPQLRPILTDVIREVLDIFDSPPFLHLGGDEVAMAAPCMDEVGLKAFDYQAFEETLTSIVGELGYPQDQIVRWESTDVGKVNRTGHVLQFWMSQNGQLFNWPAGKRFASTGLYFDTNADVGVLDIFVKTKAILQRTQPTAIIAGTFELNPQWWFDRNVLGRLLAVSLGASEWKLPKTEVTEEKNHAVAQLYREQCSQVRLGKATCGQVGKPVIRTPLYKMKWEAGWEQWRTDICQRMTFAIPSRKFSVAYRSMAEDSFYDANSYYWKVFGDERSKPLVIQDRVPKVGVLVDLTLSAIPMSNLSRFLEDYVSKLGLNYIQVRLAGSNALAVQTTTFPTMSDARRPKVQLSELAPWIERAAQLGVEVVPELSVATNVTGWHRAGYVANCPLALCNDQTTFHNLQDSRIFPVLYAVLDEVFRTFRSNLVHLGADERSSALDCYREAFGGVNITEYHLMRNSFEARLARLLEHLGYRSDQVVRYANAEDHRYESRAGKITHYLTIPGSQPDEPFFLTIDVSHGTAWQVYQRTREYAARRPEGLVAYVHNATDGYHLLAFSMGLGHGDAMEENQFDMMFAKLCAEHKLSCQPPDVTPLTAVDQCELLTREYDKHVARESIPQYDGKGQRKEVF